MSENSTHIATDQQSKPKGFGAHINPLVIEDLKQRNAHGEAKYGEGLRAQNGRAALVDAYQEVLDLAQYIRQEIEEDASAWHVIQWIDENLRRGMCVTWVKESNRVSDSPIIGVQLSSHSRVMGRGVTLYDAAVQARGAVLTWEHVEKKSFNWKT